ncbi:MAG: hypothetical protein KGI97_05160 [Alphaproteobacteria bacterium]|nr:hypothetical protein [Alphaproteobacteria bacterium]
MKYIAFLASFFFVCTAYAADIPQDSLFFTPQQMAQAETMASQNAPPGTGNLSLGAIFYYGADDWTVWLRGERWTPETRRKDIRILTVAPDRVRLAWRDDGGKERLVTLHPNQTYQIASGRIIR